MSEGTVIKFDGTYGFIKPDTGGHDLFVHFSNIVADGFRKLEPGQKVKYELGDRFGRPQAINVQILEEEVA